MDKKYIIIGGVVLTLIGVGAYFIVQNKKKSEENKPDLETESETDNSNKPTDKSPIVSSPVTTTPSSKPETELAQKPNTTSKPNVTSNKELVTRKDKRKACGIKPLLKGKKRDLWQKCVNEGGISGFDGHDSKMDYSMFDGILSDIQM